MIPGTSDPQTSPCRPAGAPSPLLHACLSDRTASSPRWDARFRNLSGRFVCQNCQHYLTAQSTLTNVLQPGRSHPCGAVTRLLPTACRASSPRKPEALLYRAAGDRCGRPARPSLRPPTPRRCLRSNPLRKSTLPDDTKNELSRIIGSDCLICILLRYVLVLPPIRYRLNDNPVYFPLVGSNV